jgi:hypothetical protein
MLPVLVASAIAFFLVGFVRAYSKPLRAMQNALDRLVPGVLIAVVGFAAMYVVLRFEMSDAERLWAAIGVGAATFGAWLNVIAPTGGRFR